MGMSRCCCGCRVIEYTNDRQDPYTIIHGNWTAINHGIETSDNGAKILFNKTFDPDQSWSETITITINITTPITGTPIEMFNIQLIGGDSYVTYGNNGYMDYLELYDVRSVDDLVKCATLDGLRGDTNYISNRYSFSFTLCWNGSVLTVSFRAGTNPNPSGISSLQSSTTYVPTGNNFGFYVKNIHPNVTSVQFTNFYLDKISDGVTNIRCAACAEHCCLGPIPSLVLELSSSGSMDTNSDPYVECIADCNLLTGTFILSEDSVGQWVGINRFGTFWCSGDIECQWLYTSDYFNVDCIYVIGYPYTYTGTWRYVIIATITADGNGNRMLLISIYKSVASVGLEIVRFFTLTITPCIDWTNWIDLDIYDVDDCSTTARIKAL